MALSFTSLQLGTSDATALADFYGKVLQREPDWHDGDWYAFHAGSCSVVIGPHSEVSGKSPAPQRMMINLETKEVEDEFERIKALGAKVVAEPYDPDQSGMKIATFEDPDGNYFQLLPPWE